MLRPVRETPRLLGDAAMIALYMSCVHLFVRLLVRHKSDFDQNGKTHHHANKVSP